MLMHPKCVIFDLGGVVFSSPIGRLGELEVQMNMKKDTLNRHIMHSTSWKRMETGATSYSNRRGLVAFNSLLNSFQY